MVFMGCIQRYTHCNFCDLYNCHQCINIIYGIFNDFVYTSLLTDDCPGFYCVTRPILSVANRFLFLVFFVISPLLLCVVN